MAIEPTLARLRVALLSTAAVGAPGSMRAYADTLIQALRAHAPGIEPELVELEPRTAKGRLGSRWQTFSQPWRARRLPQRPQVWHVLDGSRACLASRLPGAPVVVTVHDIIPWLQHEGRFPGQPRLGPAARRWWQDNARAMRDASLLVCDSANTANDAREAFGVSLSRCAVVPLPLPQGIAGRADGGGQARGDGIVLHVGNNAFYKNRAGALRIFAAMEPSLARQLLMIGPAPGPELLSLAAELGIQQRTRWLADPDDAAVAEAYRRSGVLLFPSLYEGYGWPVLEAMAFGLPVVCSNAGSLPELASDPERCLAPDNIEGFARAAERYLQDSSLAAEAGQAGIRHAAKFSAAAFGKAMADCYLRAARSRTEACA